VPLELLTVASQSLREKPINKENNMTQSTSNKPVHSIRYGNVRVAIWQNEKGFCNVTMERSYKKPEGWERANSFGRDDLPKLQNALEEAYRWIFQSSATPENGEASDE